MRFPTLLVIAASALLPSCSEPALAPSSEQVQVDQLSVLQAERERLRLELQEAYRIAVQEVLDADQVAGRSGTAAQVSSAMRQIDLTRTPPEFREAYTIHRQAWDDIALLNDAMNLTNSQGAFEDLIIDEGICLLLGCSGAPVVNRIDMKNRLDQARNDAVLRARSSFQTVEQIAARYGAGVVNAAE